jgi:hypothetical protein
MLTFGAPAQSFHARVDLPPAADVADAVEPLLHAAVRNRVSGVAFVLYTEDAALGSCTAAILRDVFDDAGLDVVTVLRADGRCWFPLDGPTGPPRPEGRPYDIASHPFAAQAVYDGAVTHRDRSALVASVAALPAAVAGVAEGLPAALARLPDLERAAEGGWVVETVHDVVRGERRLSDDEVARLVVAITDVGLRDAAWLQMERTNAARHVALWTDVLRRTPEELVAAPACLLAFAAWLAGHGALAWCAIDRCLAAEPDYSLAECISLALDQAISPTVWEGLGPEAATAVDQA